MEKYIFKFDINKDMKNIILKFGFNIIYDINYNNIKNKFEFIDDVYEINDLNKLNKLNKNININFDHLIDILNIKKEIEIEKYKEVIKDIIESKNKRDIIYNKVIVNNDNIYFKYMLYISDYMIGKEIIDILKSIYKYKFDFNDDKQIINEIYLLYEYNKEYTIINNFLTDGITEYMDLNESIIYSNCLHEFEYKYIMGKKKYDLFKYKEEYKLIPTIYNIEDELILKHVFNVNINIKNESIIKYINIISCTNLNINLNKFIKLFNNIYIYNSKNININIYKYILKEDIYIKYSSNINIKVKYVNIKNNNKLIINDSKDIYIDDKIKKYIFFLSINNNNINDINKYINVKFLELYYINDLYIKNLNNISDVKLYYCHNITLSYIKKSLYKFKSDNINIINHNPNIKLTYIQY